MGHIAPLQQSGPGKIITASPAAGLASSVPNNSSARSDLTMRTHDITHAVAVIPGGHHVTKLFFASVRSIFHAMAYKKKICISSIEILRWSFGRARLKVRAEAMMLQC